MAFLRNIRDMAVTALPISTAGVGAGVLLSDKEDIKDKLKTGLVTGAGASTGVVLPSVYNSLVHKPMELSKTRANTVLDRLYEKSNLRAEQLYDEYGKNLAAYKTHNLGDLFDEAQRTPIRRKARAKAQIIVNKVRAKHRKLQMLRLPLLMAGLAAGGYAGYNYMED